MVRSRQKSSTERWQAGGEAPAAHTFDSKVAATSDSSKHRHLCVCGREGGGGVADDRSTWRSILNRSLESEEEKLMNEQVDKRARGKERNNSIRLEAAI